MKKNNIIVITLILSGLVVLFLLILNSKNLFSGYKAENLYKQAEKLTSENKKEEAAKIYEGIIKNFPKTRQAGQALYALAGIYEAGNQLLKAREIYENLISNSPDLDFISSVQDRLGNLNIKILFSPLKTQDSQMYEVQTGDTLSKIAAQFHTSLDLIKKSNNLRSDNIRPGADLKINTAKFSLIADKSQNLLTLKANEKVIKLYHVSTGANNCTPTGTFTITSKLVNPVWYTAGAVVPSGSPDNILGSRWLGLSKPGYGIHGTTQPESIGTQATQGCIRLRNADVEELFIILPLGTEVTIVD